MSQVLGRLAYIWHIDCIYSLKVALEVIKRHRGSGADTLHKTPRDGSIGRAAGNSISTIGAERTRRERNPMTFGKSESKSIDGNNGWHSPTGSTMSVNIISAATTQTLQSVEVNELHGEVSTLAHRVQALKAEQAIQQSKIHQMEEALEEAEEKLNINQNGQEATAAE
ncbi:hypothetical protein EDD21DRAFT_436118 [Dissophora ornata]|nr:hypothetical protein EDD21DRAFT_436118 [Dissophora ornata]